MFTLLDCNLRTSFQDLDMLVLKRKDGQWIEVTHKSGDVLRFRVYNITADPSGRANLAFDDEARNFDIQRPERFLKAAPQVAESY